MRLKGKPVTWRMLGVQALRKAARRLGYRIDFRPASIREGKGDRIEYLARLARRASALSGDIVECGMGTGQSFAALAGVAHEHGKALHGFDSFAGFPEPSAEDSSARITRKGDWSHASVEDVRRKLLETVPRDFCETSVTITPGFFADTLPGYPVERICFLHLDGDLYESYMECLRALYDKVVPGGVIALDECLHGTEYAKFPGAFAAIDEFLEGRDADLCRDRKSGKYYVVKR